MTVSTFDIIDSNFDDFIVQNYSDYNRLGNWGKINRIRTELRSDQFTWGALTRKGVSLPVLENVYFSGCLVSTWMITRRKRDWCRMQFQRVVEYFDLVEG
tara:strand:+ start:309 stop:608 length:300 start_codon:yes stop_codon:yes gene_type:complete